MTPNFESSGVDSGYGRVAGYGQQNEHGEGQTFPPRPLQEPAPVSRNAVETEHKKVLVLNTDSEDSGGQSGDRKRGRRRASSEKRSKSVTDKDPVGSASRGRARTVGKDPLNQARQSGGAL